MTDEVGGQSHGEKLASVIGKNAQRLRRDAGLTLDQVSIAAKMRGLNWSESRVADFEASRVAPNLTTLIAVVLCLRDAGCAKATLTALLHSARPIQINDSLELSDGQVVNLVTGRRARTPKPSDPKRKKAPSSSTQLEALESAVAELSPPPDVKAILRALIIASGATEERTWKALDISRTELADWSARLWGRTFSEERDRRAGKGANAQKRGQVSRQLREELKAAIEAANHGDYK
jgi:transcriptional regulator with XRE-family HTH domain